jgi:hypothetical protein
MLGVLIFIALEIRPTAIILIPAILFYAIFHKRSLIKGVLVTTGTFGILMVLLSLLYPVEGNYVEMMRSFYAMKDRDELYRHLTYMLNLYIEDFRGLFAAGNTKTTVNLLVYFIGGYLFFIGWVKRTLKGPEFMEVLLLGYFIMIIFWPGHQGIRYFAPVVPIYFVYILDMMHLKGLPKTTLAFRISYTMLCFITSIVFYTSFDMMSEKYGVTGPNSSALFDEIENVVPEDAVIMSLKPRAICLMTDRGGIVFPDEDHRDALQSCIQENSVGYMVIPAYGGGPGYIKTEILPDTLRYHELYRNDEWLLFQLR